MSADLFKDFGLGGGDMFENMAWNSPEEASIKTLESVLRVTGYVAGRKNALTKDINEVAAKEAFEKAKMEALAREGKSTIFVTKVGADGKEAKGQIEISQDTKYTKTGLRALDLQAYEDCVRGYYKVNTKELRPEFLSAEILSRAGKTSEDLNLSESESSIQRAAKAVSENGQFVLIKEADLVKTLLEHNTKYVNVVDGETTKGRAIPFMKQSKKKPEKFTIKFTYTDNNKNIVKGGIGHLGVPHAVNRDYVGAVPADIAEITNQKKVEELFPGINVAGIGETKEFVKYEDGTTMRQREEIPYSAYANEYAKMGVSEKMLEDIRGKSAKKVDALAIEDIYTQSKRAYELFKTL